ncbi:sensor histidine kinase [Virgibacillus alimentarius]|uniref:histidine kinase n=1 Tax=Virgibacillus alimentarius TaxID=698769 RepID=A0ABS4SB33_9BACI|nr:MULTISPECIES: sensor histidine kinase [Virgibacillus]MBP2258728.1 two-component system sensor histidine kinase DesK [Virgibacillus alimentarius]HLR66877.1 sensor histidine kinase [Virgibacillus sp.]
MPKSRPNWFHIIPRSTGLSSYVWVIFCILPFYFVVFRSSSLLEIIFGIIMILLFFTAYRVSFLSKGWTVYLSVSIEMIISIVMTLVLGYVYFSLFLAFYIGNIQRKAGFITLYIVHLVTTIIAISIRFFMHSEIFFSQLPFIIITILGVILLPLNIYNRNKRERLEDQLKRANEKISQLVVLEERQRIARDLHDILGQKLSLIGLKSDLAGKLIDLKPNAAKLEIDDIHQTARTALKEVRELVSDMKGVRLEDELVRVRQILQAAQIDLYVHGDNMSDNTPLLAENVLAMCLKEAVTNVVKHSKASICTISITHSPNDMMIKVQDNGMGFPEKIDPGKENGLQGMRERLEFINGSLETYTDHGAIITFSVPNVIQQTGGD